MANMTDSDFGLFRQLSDGAFHSGEELGELLGISRAAIWKRVNALESRSGHRVERIAGKGYRLLQPVEFLCVERIRTGLDRPLDVHLYQTLGSTNEQAKTDVRHNGSAFLVLAEEQRQGRGRRGRIWHSPYASNLYLTLAWPLTGGLREAEGMSLITGLAVRNVLAAHGLPQAGIKWPNDVLVQDKKIAGILLELVGDPADQGVVIIGIGINVNMDGDFQPISQDWTSISLETGNQLSRNHLAAAMANELIAALELNRKQGFQAFIGQWEEHHHWQGRTVVVSSGDNRIEGRVVGIDSTGALRLDTDDGIQSFAGGEVTLRLQDDSGT